MEGKKSHKTFPIFRPPFWLQLEKFSQHDAASGGPHSLFQRPKIPPTFLRGFKHWAYIVRGAPESLETFLPKQPNPADKHGLTAKPAFVRTEGASRRVYNLSSILFRDARPRLHFSKLAKLAHSCASSGAEYAQTICIIDN